MKKKLTMRYPATWHRDMWREGAPFGNGIIGGMVYGGVFKEIILINHAYLWRGGKDAELPYAGDVLPEIRRLLDAKKIKEADALLADTMKKRGFDADITMPLPLADIVLKSDSRIPFSHYRRVVDMERSLVTVSWKEDGTSYRRETFVSRVSNKIFTRITCENGVINTKAAVTLHDPETLGDLVIPKQENFSKGNTSYFAAYNDSVYKPGDYGILCKVFTDGITENEGPFVCVKNATSVLLVADVFVGGNRREEFDKLEEQLCREYDFEKELENHTAIHSELFNRIDFSISDPESDTSNEELLLDSFEESSSGELLEKLYAFGRYLMLCCTDKKDALPYHMLGLFNGTYQCIFAHYMYNANFAIMYWQALSGRMPELMRLALDYVESTMDQYRDNAKKVFGCRGILINSVNTPESGVYKCMGHHIANWTGSAAWIAQHFYDYFQYTGDLEYLKEHVMPFMYEVALFYEDFAVENEDGYYDLYPSVSPENVSPVVKERYGNTEIETSKNATMEFALLKELLTNLLEACRITGLYQEKVDTWRKMLSKVRPYMINEDGAVKEWMDPYYTDHYKHRHHSHLYPVFPGCEITKESDLYQAFERAEDLRLEAGLFDQSSWSMVFMAGIAARMGRGEHAYTALNMLGRTCLMNNFLTVHNDWRRMGPASCGDFRMAPVQIDGNTGIPAVIHEMLVQSQRSTFEESRIEIFPALPEKWTAGHLCGLLVRGNIICDLYWQRAGGYVVLKSHSGKKAVLKLAPGWMFEDGKLERNVEFNGEIKVEFLRVFE